MIGWSKLWVIRGGINDLNGGALELSGQSPGTVEANLESNILHMPVRDVENGQPRQRVLMIEVRQGWLPYIREAKRHECMVSKNEKSLLVHGVGHPEDVNSGFDRGPVKALHARPIKRDGDDFRIVK